MRILPLPASGAPSRIFSLKEVAHVPTIRRDRYRLRAWWLDSRSALYACRAERIGFLGDPNETRILAERRRSIGMAPLQSRLRCMRSMGSIPMIQRRRSCNLSALIATSRSSTSATCRRFEARSPPARRRQSRAQPDQAHRQRHRSPGPDCPRPNSHLIARETKYSDCGHHQRQSASSNPPAKSMKNHIIGRCFHTAWIINGPWVASELGPLIPQQRTSSDY